MSKPPPVAGSWSIHVLYTSDRIRGVHLVDIKFGDLIQARFDKHLVWQIGQGLPSNDLLRTVLALVLAVTLVWRLKKNHHQTTKLKSLSNVLPHLYKLYVCVHQYC